ncbi:hypothetical protein D3C84_452720 [compost metagenome]
MQAAKVPRSSCSSTLGNRFEVRIPFGGLTFAGSCTRRYRARNTDSPYQTINKSTPLRGSKRLCTMEFVMSIGVTFNFKGLVVPISGAPPSRLFATTALPTLTQLDMPAPHTAINTTSIHVCRKHSDRKSASVHGALKKLQCSWSAQKTPAPQPAGLSGHWRRQRRYRRIRRATPPLFSIGLRQADPRPSTHPGIGTRPSNGYCSNLVQSIQRRTDTGRRHI